jgi:GDP-4-dehydro-6-deoxy-D-mannose reductase
MPIWTAGKKGERRMKVLVTGADGFVGRYVVPELRRAGHTPLEMIQPGAAAGLPEEPTAVACDVRDADGLRRLVGRVQPDGCIHLAGIAFVPTGWSDPELVFSVNLLGTINLLEAFRHEAPSARLLVVTSSEVYGRPVSSAPLTEDAPLAAANLYAVSKLSADRAALLYARRYGMPVMTARPQNHIGPGQSTQFVATSFAAQLADMADRGGAGAVIRVGNLDCERNFTDVRDVARAYRLLVERGRPGEGYNIGSGQLVKVAEILRLLCHLAGVQPRVEVDPERYRPLDNPPTLDIRKILQHTGWKPEMDLSDTLRDIYEDIRRPRPATA